MVTKNQLTENFVGLNLSILEFYKSLNDQQKIFLGFVFSTASELDMELITNLFSEKFNTFEQRMSHV